MVLAQPFASAHSAHTLHLGTQARGTLALGSTGVTLRAIARLGTTGIDLELGAAKRFSAAVTGYVGTQFGYPAGERCGRNVGE